MIDRIMGRTGLDDLRRDAGLVGRCPLGAMPRGRGTGEGVRAGVPPIPPLFVEPIFLCLVSTHFRKPYKCYVQKIKSRYRAGHPICRKVLKLMFWDVPPADWLIL